MKLAAVCLLFSSLAGAAADYRIAGVLVDAASGSPIARGRVTLARTDDRLHGTVAITPDNGRFAFEGLSAGKYALHAERRGYLRRSYGQGRGNTGVSVVAGAGEDTGNLVFRLPRGAVICGKVTDEADEPVAQAMVQLFRSAVVYGRRRAHPQQFAWANDRGEYRFSGLVEGAYYFVVSGEPWYGTKYLWGGGIKGTAFMPQFYPGTADPKAATPLSVKAGEEATADFSLASTRGATVRIDSPKDVSYQVVMGREGVAGQDFYVFASRGPAGNHVVTLPWGSYFVQGFGSGSLSGRQTIDVHGEEMDVHLVPEDRAVLSGTVELRPPNDAAGQKLRAVLRNDKEQPVGRRPIGPGGAFNFDELPAGRYSILLEGSRASYLERVLADGAPVGEGGLNVAPGGIVRVQLVARTDGGTVEGKLYRGGRPLAGVMMILAPRAPEAPVRDYRLFMTDSDGSFEFEGVKPGDYDLAASPDADEIEYANAEAMKPFRAAAHKVRVEVRGRHTVKIELQAAPSP